MAKLSPGQVETFVLRDVEAFAAEQVQQVLDITQANLHQWLRRAWSRMRQCLNTNWFNPEAGVDASRQD
jgi:DNA-directed RNA polymerase specialized sigma24 family protein